MGGAGRRMQLGTGAIEVGVLGAVDLRLVGDDIDTATAGDSGFEGHGDEGFQTGGSQWAIS